ncbi:MAG TPA: 3-oxoacyl-[acyl-carrier-protein] reductase [Ferruginibacter sp.]|jgi:3-oxoacyl-[acyl-carrier protein] reductase|nr:3-oxoacyl-[acyl-carrier-protein] reductase [Bacteroidota bacterium]MBS1926834.1 3-oxoacyl-[acyl-carrier-protein] reductase [Bacteroidota bacterium]MCC6692235.1 3-oxoacyl-[acyl-carrier-protein] reductase [Chitinophagaceae bacterium]HMT95165.1 3-oxoacyl-[acyl-carrier-protein] reductase [Ferruginibacter sp.]HMU23550.1 3-oxoacyl-[acyl-carrier-protein] reductase [Ferruginibacter sp.]
MKLLQGKTAIVTGAARGIGEAIAIRFAENGANVAFSYVSDSSAEKAAALEAKLISLGVKAKAYKSNAGDFAQCEAFVNDVIKEMGTVDICVNNAGISKDNLLLRMSPEQWNDVIQVNLNSVFNMTKQVIKVMMKAKSGSIINMSSVIGEMGNAGQSSYAASKAGIIGFTKSVAKELGSRNIRCNAIAPGFVETDMTAYLKDGEGADKYKSGIPLGRFASPDDIANVSLFLASDLSSYITGQTISVCGGLNI